MVIWIELTSPWEENMTWNFEKHDRYRNIVNAAEGNGWKVVPLCVEADAEVTSMTNGTIWREL